MTGYKCKKKNWRKTDWIFTIVKWHFPLPHFMMIIIEKLNLLRIFWNLYSFMIDVLMDLFDLNRNFSLPKQNKQTVQQQKKNREKTGFIVRSLVVIILVSFFSTTFLNSNEKKNRMDFHVLWRKIFFFSTIFISIFEVVHNWLPKGIHQSIKFLLVCLLFPTTLRKHKTNTHIMEYFWENKKNCWKKIPSQILGI